MDYENTATLDSGLFGFQKSYDQSDIAIIPVPWDATVSYRRGTHQGPQHILQASTQLDFFDPETGSGALEAGIYMDPIPEDLLKLNQEATDVCMKVQQILETSDTSKGDELSSLTHQANELCSKMVNRVYVLAKKFSAEGKLVGLIGGDHSTPLGLIEAVGQNTSGDFGVLHIDAHHDFRDSYQGFENSHASIMNNVMKLQDAPKALVQFGIRDYSKSEFEFAKNDPRIHVLYDKSLHQQLHEGKSFAEVVRPYLDKLPQNVYVSVDIDGFDPALCPDTGTPVPGGLDYNQYLFLLDELRRQGKKLVGFDLVEVGPSTDPENEYNGNVGARVLYQLCRFGHLSRTSK